MTDSQTAEIPAEIPAEAPAPPRWLTLLARRPKALLALLGLLLWLPGVLRLCRCARDLDAPAPSSTLVLLGWAAAAAGILVKFPVVPAVALVTVIGLGAWDLWLRRKSGEGRVFAWLKSTNPVRGVIVALV